MEQDMLTTLEVCYEFYLRGFTFDRMDLDQVGGHPLHHG